MASALVVFGTFIVAFSIAIACALGHSNAWQFLKNFVLSVMTLLGLAGAGAMMGVIYRAALKALP